MQDLSDPNVVTMSDIAAEIGIGDGNVATIEPQPGACCADHMEHQMLPLTAWGGSYIGLPPASPTSASVRNPSIYRITGAFDGTTLTYSPVTPPGAPTTINAEQTVAFQTDLAFVVQTTDENKPFGFTEFLLSNQIINPFGEPGDPAMWAIPAVDQYQDFYVFLVPDGYTNNYVTIVRPQGVPVTLDGSPVTSAFSIAGTDGQNTYEFTTVPLFAGSHTISADEPVGIYSYGYAQDVSYAYPGGSGVAVISEPPPPPAG